MDEKIIEEILDTLIPTFESIEAHSLAVLAFLKDKGLATDEQLKPYLQQAENASNVKWRATRVRMERLLSSLAKGSKAAEPKQKQRESNAEKPSPEQTASQTQEESEPKPDENQAEKQAAALSEKPAVQSEATAERDRKPEMKPVSPEEKKAEAKTLQPREPEAKSA